MCSSSLLNRTCTDIIRFYLQTTFRYGQSTGKNARTVQKDRHNIIILRRWLPYILSANGVVLIHLHPAHLISEPTTSPFRG